VAAEWGTTVSNDAEGGLVGAVCAAIRQVVTILVTEIETKFEYDTI